jgi:hypothetical protein
MWNQGHDFLYHFLLEKEVIVVDSELAHEEEGLAEEFLALCTHPYPSFQLASCIKHANK